MGCATTTLRTPETRREFAEAVIGNWSDFSRTLARKFIAEYGPPDQVKYSRLVWNDKGPWKSTTVWDVPPYYDSDFGEDILEQTIPYPIPLDRRPALAEFSDRVRVSKGGSALSVRATSEELNFLTANLAHELLSGIQQPATARRFYDRTLQLSAAGKSSPYMQGLLFAGAPSRPAP